MNDQASNNQRIALAKIAGVHGIKGIVKIQPFGEDPALIGEIDPIYIDGKPAKITLKNSSGKYILAAIDGLEIREEAAKLKGALIEIDAHNLPELEDGEDGFYYHDLIGREVYTPSDELIGSIIAVENFGASDLLEIKTTLGKEFYIPFTEEYVPEVDPKIILKNYKEFLEQ